MSFLLLFLIKAKIGSLEQQLNEAPSSAKSRQGSVAQSNLKLAEDNVDSSAVTKKLEEELLKRDALIEVCCIFFWALIQVDCILFNNDFFKNTM